MNADAAFDAMDDTLFDAFGVDGSVVRGVAAPVPVRVVLTRGVERLGEYGQVVARVTTASFRNREWAPRPGDVLTVDARTRAIDDILKDDGYVAEAVLHG